MISLYHCLFLERDQNIFNNITEFLPLEMLARNSATLKTQDSSPETMLPGGKYNHSSEITPMHVGTYVGHEDGKMAPHICG